MNNLPPRRAYIDKHTPTERAIRHAIDMVESLGAGLELTAAVVALSKAFEAVADWTDGQAASVASMAAPDAEQGKRWEPGPISIIDFTGPPMRVDPAPALKITVHGATEANITREAVDEAVNRAINPAFVPSVVPLTKPQTAGAIKVLENMLEIAKTKGLTGVGIVAVDMEGCTSSAYEQGHNIALLLGAMAVLNSRILAHYQKG